MQRFNTTFPHDPARGKWEKRNFRKVFSAFMLAVFFALLFSKAWGSVTQGDLTGKVVDKQTGNPIANVFVTATGVGATYSTTTDNTGFFSIVDLPPGTYTLKLERVGYQSTTVTDIQISANSTFYQTFQLEPAVYQVQGVTVSGYRNQMINPHQTMTYYAFTKQDLKELLPAVASYSITGILSELPGVQTYTPPPGFALGGPHVRGGTGLGLVYAIDGIPLNNTSFFNDLGNVNTTVGVSDYQFYPGIYPVQYGNGIDGYQNTIIPQGYGEFHGDLAFSYGFWLDPGENAPLFNAANGQFVGTTNERPPNPNDWDLEFSGQVKKFHYYFNYLARDGGGPGFNNPSSFAALAFSGQGGTTWRGVVRDGVLNLNYDFDPSNSMQALFMDGFRYSSTEFQCFSSADCGFTIPPGDGSFSPVPPYVYSHYDLESLGYTHRFSPGNAMTLRLWNYTTEPDQFIPSPADGFYTQDNLTRSTAGRLEFKLQLNDQNAVTVGGQYIYNKSFTHAFLTGLGGPALAFFAAVLGQSLQATADTQNPSAWFNEEWTPTPKWDINLGVRWDEMIYRPLCGPGILTQANCLPYASETFTGFSPDFQINNPADTAGLFTGTGANTTPLLHVASNLGILQPSFVQPRVSASYRVTDDFTVKAGWGEFNTFSPSGNVDFLSQLCAAGTGASTFTPCNVVGQVALTTAGNVAQTGQDYDLSLEYMLDQDSGTFVKVTPYYKTVNNPLIFTFIPIANTGGEVNASSLTAKGVELVLHTRDWHGLTGTLNYTYNQTRIIGDPEYTLLLLPNFTISSSVTGASISGPNVLPNFAALYNQVNTTPIPADWDIPHTLNLLLDYKTQDKKWEIAPNFTYASGQPYGLGLANLQSLFANLNAYCAGQAVNPAVTCPQDVPSTFSTTETTPNSLRSQALFLGNLAITYHVSPNVSTTFQIFNLWNNDQVLAFNSLANFAQWMAILGYPNSPDYSPLKGNYAPGAVQTIRSYFITTTFNF
jgi:hypothetical protein